MQGAARSRRVAVRGLDYHLLEWGAPGAPTLVLLHGWMDVAASFQFLVQAFTREWYVLAPDWQGFGETAWRNDGYWFYDYIADLDALLTHESPDVPVHLVGHSLGANAATLYAGVRPARVRSVVALDGFGIPWEDASRAPQKLAAWLDALATPPTLSSYADLSAVADRLQRNNPRLPRDKALVLAGAWAAMHPDGRAYLRADPRHKLPFPAVYRMEEIIAIWQAVEAPVLWVGAAESTIPRWLAPEGDPEAEIARRIGHVKHSERVTIADAGHMLHHDQPVATAQAIEAFLARVGA
jgi:pimeloyl-ACP methyl ester carboxylesterase